MTETYENDLVDVLKLQRDVAESIAQKVRLKLTPGEKAQLHQALEVNPEAFEAYLTARYFDLTRRQGIKKAQSYYERAIQKDPNFAPAYVGLVQTYYNLGQFRWLSPQDAYLPAKQATRKALELDENNCFAHYWVALVAWRYDWDWPTTESEFARAIELCPNDARIRWYHAYYLAWSNRVAKAEAEMTRTREIDPFLEVFLRYKMVIYFHLRNFKSLLELGRKYVASHPDIWWGHYWLGVAYEGSGQARDAIPEYQKAVELSEGDQDPAAALAHAYAATGRKEEAKKILREWQHQSESSYISSYMIATAYASLGEKDKAFEYLEKAYQERSSDLPYFLRADLRIDSLRSDPRFQDLLRRMNFPQ